MTSRIPLSAALVAAALALAAAPASGAGLTVIVASDIEAAILPVVQAFERETRHVVDIDTGGTAGMRRASDMGKADVFVASAGRVDAMIRQGKAQSAGRRDIGSVGLGVFVREGARVPAIGTAEQMRNSLLAASGIVYGRTSESGRLAAKIMRSLALGADVEAKTTRSAEPADFVRRSRSDDIGIAGVPEILADMKGLKFVGPLPAGMQERTPFAAAVVTGSAAADAARAFVDYLAAPASKAKLVAAGFE